MSVAAIAERIDVDEIETLQLKIGGISCSFCATSIEKAVGRQRGVDEVHVSIAHEEALIRFRPEKTSSTKIKDTLRALGYTIRDPRNVHDAEEQAALARSEQRDLASAAFFAAVLLGAMAGMWLDLWPRQPWLMWTAWAIASFVFFWNGRRIIHKAWGAAWRGITNQHVLLSVGAIGAYVGGVLGTPVPPLGWTGLPGFPAMDFFGVVVFLTAYHLLSGVVSLYVRTKASASVRKLLEMQPPTARVVRDGVEEEIDIDEVVLGDMVRVRPGERIPVDGTVADGISAVDQSIVTGEPIPEDKKQGDEVIGGSINQSGTLLVAVTRIGEDSFLRQIARHVEEAKALKPGIIVLVDRVLQYYVPAVLGIAVLAFLYWGLAPLAWGGQPLWVTAIFATVTVLVMGYPCALGMATPLALIRGGGMAAERGILIRSGEAFQVLKDITHVVLDKTGTITEGKPRLVAVDVADGYEPTEVLRLAAGAEALSEHPLARAIVDAAAEQALEIPEAGDFQATPGKGVEAQVAGYRVVIGTRRFLTSQGIAVATLEQATRAHEAQAHTAVLAAIDGHVAGVLAIADTIKADAPAAIAEMKSLGIAPVMLTGDNRRTAEAVAAQVGIDDVHAQVLPQEKADHVRAIQQQKDARVVMVGDGINDAPALMQADVGMAIGAGTDIAIESSDVIIIGNRVGAVMDARRIGKLSYSKTVQNLWLAFMFNGVGVPLATTGLIHPSWAMLAMATSVSLVLANSFGGRLLKRSPAQIDRATPPSSEETTTPSPNAGADVRLSVPDIQCQGCVETIKAGLLAEDGIEAVEGDAETKTIRVHYSESITSSECIEAAIARFGYRVNARAETTTSSIA